MATMTINGSPTVSSLPSDSFAAEMEVFQEKLSLVLEKYEQWKDPLSKRLFACGTDLLAIHPDKLVLFPEEQEKALRIIDELAHKILVNSLDNSPLFKPWIDRDIWVWEKSMLDDYRSIGPEAPSPFDNQPFDVKPHNFALDMLDWMSALPIEMGLPEKPEKVESKRSTKSFETVKASDDSIEDQQLRFATYQINALAFVANQLTEQTKKLNATIVECSKKVDDIKESTEKLAKQEAERADISGKAHVESAKAMNAATKKANDATVKVLKSSLKDTNNRLTKKTQELNVSLGKQEALEHRAAALERANHQLSGEVAQLRHANRGSDCIIC